MFRTKLINVKKSCCVLFIPKILQGGLKSTPGGIYKRTYEVLSRLSKSTVSGTDDEYKKKLSIIDKCFAPKVSNESEIENSPTKVNFEEITTPYYTKETECDKCHGIITKAFEESKNNNEDEINNAISLGDHVVQSTVSKQTEEKLIQKIENIDETSVVEADTSNIEAVNIPSSTLNDTQTYRPEESDKNQLNSNNIAKSCLSTGYNWLKINEKPSVSSTCSKEVPQVTNVLNKYKDKTSDKLDNYITQNVSQTHKDQIVENEHGISTNHGLNKYQIGSIHDHNINKETIGEVETTITENTLTPKRSNDISVETDTEESIEKIKEAAPNQCTVVAAESVSESKNVDILLTKFERENKNPLQNTIIDETEVKKNKTALDAYEMKESKIERVDLSQNIVYSNVENTEDNEQEVPQQTNQNQEKFIIPNTAISGTFPIPPPCDSKPRPDTAISANQDLNDLFSGITLVDTVFDYPKENKNPFDSESPVVQNILSTQLNSTQDAISPDFTYKSIHPISQVIYESQLKPMKETALKSARKPTPKAAENLSAEALKSSAHFFKLSAEARLLDMPRIRQDMPLSEILRIVRRRNRLQFYRDIAQVEEDIVMKRPPCLPPLETSGKPQPMLHPSPCQPKPKGPPPSRPPKKDPCAPKKDPCAKFSTLIAIFQNILKICFSSRLLTTCVSSYIPYKFMSTQATLPKEVMEGSNKLGDSSPIKHWINDQSFYVRDFQPWSPIPSLPYPKKEEKKPFVCPKEGCKMNPPPNFWGLCTKNNPCRSFPSFPKRRFSSSPYQEYF